MLITGTWLFIPLLIISALDSLSPQVGLEYVHTLGWVDESQASRELTPRESSYGGAVLGSIAGIAADERGRVFVLDRDYKKIVVFDSAGDYSGLILGGYGRGPGEFVRPSGLSYWNGELAAGDSHQGRISVFTASGEHSRDIRLPFRAFAFHYQNDIVHTLGLFSRIRPVTTMGIETDAYLTFKPEWLSLVEHGSLGAIGTGMEDGLVYAAPVIGVHVLIDSDGRTREVGKPLWQEIRVGTYSGPGGTPVRYVPASVLNVGIVKERYIITVWRAHPDPLRVAELSPPPPAGSHWLLVQKAEDGSVVGQVRLDEERTMTGRYQIVERGGRIYLYASVFTEADTPGVDVYQINGF